MKRLYNNLRIQQKNYIIIKFYMISDKFKKL